MGSWLRTGAWALFLWKVRGLQDKVMYSSSKQKQKWDKTQPFNSWTIFPHSRCNLALSGNVHTWRGGRNGSDWKTETLAVGIVWIKHSTLSPENKYLMYIPIVTKLQETLKVTCAFPIPQMRKIQWSRRRRDFLKVTPWTIHW